MSEIPEYDYDPPGEVVEKFLNSNAFIRGIRGPLGSGKSTACVMEILLRAREQAVNVFNKRQSRWAVIRNTYPELKTTTIKTWHQWTPAHIGHWKDSGPPTHLLQDRMEDGTDLDLEVMFIALDEPGDVAKLLSMELTGAWINEAREVPKAILDALTGRVGRFPPMRDGGPTWSGIIMDTNSPDTGHWWAKLADFMDAEAKEDLRKLEKQLREMNALSADTPLIEFFTQPPAAFADNKLNPEAENLANLVPGYYLKAMAGKKDDWIKVYIRNEYHFVMDGKAVYDSYYDNIHTVAHQYNPAWPLHIGLDFGLTPAAVFAQRHPMGQTRILSELCATRLGAKSFAREIKEHIARRYGQLTAAQYGTITGDPAGDAGAQTDETTVYQMLESEGLKALPATTNDFAIRREAVNTPFGQLIDGQPALVIHPDCQELRKACAGGYHFRRIQISSELRYDEKPNKNMSSHVAESLQYLMLGLGLGRDVIIKPQKLQRQHSAPAFATGAGTIAGW